MTHFPKTVIKIEHDFPVDRHVLLASTIVALLQVVTLRSLYFLTFQKILHALCLQLHN